MDNKQFKAFLKYFIPSAAIVILMIFLVWRNELPLAFLQKLFQILRPVLLGGALAFILNQPLNRIQRLYKKIFANVKRKVPLKKERTYFAVSLITVYILFLAILAAIVGFIVPQLISSISFFVDSFDSYYKNFNAFVDALLRNYDLSWLEEFNLLDKLYAWLYGLTAKLPEVITATFGITKNIINGVADVFIGFIFSIYVLTGKKKLKAQTGKLFRALLSEKNYFKLVDFYKLASSTFALFISGQLTEALILGVLCMIGMNIFGFEYAVLISVIIGLTNMIPIFGPLIGTIPCALILLLVNPIHAVWFVVYIVVLQQIESNLIYPRVVGGSVGLAPVWTLLAILLGGGLFGVIGMVLAVPTMSLIYTMVSRYISKRLMRKKATQFSEASIHISPDKK